MHAFEIHSIATRVLRNLHYYVCCCYSCYFMYDGANEKNNELTTEENVIHIYINLTTWIIYLTIYTWHKTSVAKGLHRWTCSWTCKQFWVHACMLLHCRWIVNSSDLIELDFDRNYIGDGGGKEIMEAMLQRKEGIESILAACFLKTYPRLLLFYLAGLADFRMTVTPRMSCQIFSSIVELSATLGGSKGKKKKRQKRKKGRWHVIFLTRV